jgi:predicted nuclease of predicted toxin-antitoxin system
MRLLANENIPRTAVDALKSSGHEVAWVRTSAPGMSDNDVLGWAIREERILLTFDKDFGELARQTRLPRTSGVILLRIPMPPAKEVGIRIAAIIDSRSDWAGHFSVVEPMRVRMRTLGSVI